MRPVFGGKLMLVSFDVAAISTSCACAARIAGSATIPASASRHMAVHRVLANEFFPANVLLTILPLLLFYGTLNAL
jgi:hypothetical protein